MTIYIRRDIIYIIFLVQRYILNRKGVYIWNDLSRSWQAAFEEAWAAFCNGSIPIGAALSDENGELILRDRNRNNDKATVNKRTAHAEACLLNRLDTSKYDPKKVTLYTTMEPCPMCMGTIIMSNIRHLRTAALDPYCGMLHLLETEPFYKARQTEYVYDSDEKELVQLAMQTYFELRHIGLGKVNVVYESFKKHNEKAVTIAEKLYSDKKLDLFVSEGRHMGYVYDYILSMDENSDQ